MGSRPTTWSIIDLNVVKLGKTVVLVLNRHCWFPVGNMCVRCVQVMRCVFEIMCMLYLSGDGLAACWSYCSGRGWWQSVVEGGRWWLAPSYGSEILGGRIQKLDEV